jgi:23S rRNA (pseudouridine1915-N3)-methyltransferase
MKIRVLAVGKNHETQYKEAVEDFTKRLKKYFQVEWLILSPPKNAASLPEKDLKKKEATLILSALGADDFLIALDETGNPFNSKELADFLQARANDSKRNCSFIIGGAYGLDDSVRNKSSFIWSLSHLTFPHQLVRLILVEQLYRACSILNNEKYHHS